MTFPPRIGEALRKRKPRLEIFIRLTAGELKRCYSLSNLQEILMKTVATLMMTLSCLSAVASTDCVGNKIDELIVSTSLQYTQHSTVEGRQNLMQVAAILCATSAPAGCVGQAIDELITKVSSPYTQHTTPEGRRNLMIVAATVCAKK